jgi:hypothetical protein
MRFCTSLMFGLLLVIVSSQTASAISMYGITQVEGGFVILAPHTLLSVFDIQSIPSTTVVETHATLPPLTLHDHVTGVLGTGSGAFTVDLDGAASTTGFVEQGALHALSVARAPGAFFCSSGPGPQVCTSGS